MKLNKEQQKIIEGCRQTTTFLIDEMDTIAPASEKEDDYLIELATLIKTLADNLTTQSRVVNSGLAGHLASKLWEVSKLRHALFTPNEFGKLCKAAIQTELDKL